MTCASAEGAGTDVTVHYYSSVFDHDHHGRTLSCTSQLPRSAASSYAAQDTTTERDKGQVARDLGRLPAEPTTRSICKFAQATHTDPTRGNIRPLCSGTCARCCTRIGRSAIFLVASDWQPRAADLEVVRASCAQHHRWTVRSCAGYTSTLLEQRPVTAICLT